MKHLLSIATTLLIGISSGYAQPAAPSLTVKNNRITQVVHDVVVARINCTGGFSTTSQRTSIAPGGTAIINFVNFAPATGQTAPNAGDAFTSIRIYDACSNFVTTVGSHCSGLSQNDSGNSNCGGATSTISALWSDNGAGTVVVDIN